jgi:hypothetical protein
MKQFTKLVIALSLFLFSHFFMPFNLFGQDNEVPGSPGDPGGDPDAPVDGGIVLLLAAGVLYGIHKLRVDKKRELNSLNSK